MSDVSITAANVVPASDAQIGTGIAGATITAGQSIQLEASSGTWKLASAATTAILAGSGGVAVAVSGASAGQPVSYIQSGTTAIGGTVVKTGIYVVSPTNPGGIAPIADLGSGNYLSILGYATTTGILAITRNATGVTK